MIYKLYYLYIVTNYNKTVLYTGITNNLEQRIIEHYTGQPNRFTTEYKAYYLLYYESSKYINNIIAREKEIKGWLREKKENLISSFNPE
jgi:putative endonuclease